MNKLISVSSRVLLKTDLVVIIDRPMLIRMTAVTTTTIIIFPDFTLGVTFEDLPEPIHGNRRQNGTKIPRFQEQSGEEIEARKTPKTRGGEKTESSFLIVHEMKKPSEKKGEEVKALTPPCIVGPVPTR